MSGTCFGAKCDECCKKGAAQMSLCVHSCQRRTFKHLTWIEHSTHMPTFCFPNLRTLKVFQLFFKNISQGNVLTCLRCDERYNDALATYLLLSPTVKEFWKWLHFPESYIRLAVAWFFDSQCTVHMHWFPQLSLL